MIPIVYGMMRIGGNIIWSQPIQETAHHLDQQSRGRRQGRLSRRLTTTTYTYIASSPSASAKARSMGCCVSGPMPSSSIYRNTPSLFIWAMKRQTPDHPYPVHRRRGSTPAFRGLAYVVFENFPMADYGNRIPNFTFEVQKKYLSADYNGETLENMITGMVMIPGGGEFVYDTTMEYQVPGAQVGQRLGAAGRATAINMQNTPGRGQFAVVAYAIAGDLPEL